MSKKYPYAKVLHYNPWNFDAEPGDIMVDHLGRAWRLYERKGSPSAAAGILCMRQIKRPGMIAINDKGELKWVPREEEKK